MKTLDSTITIKDALAAIYGCRDAASLSVRLGISIPDVESVLPTRKTVEDVSSEPTKVYMIKFQLTCPYGVPTAYSRTGGRSKFQRNFSLVKYGVSKYPKKRADTILRSLKKYYGTENIAITNVISYLPTKYLPTEVEAALLVRNKDSKVFVGSTPFSGATEIIFSKSKADTTLFKKLNIDEGYERAICTDPSLPRIKQGSAAGRAERAKLRNKIKLEVVKELHNQLLTNRGS